MFSLTLASIAHDKCENHVQHKQIRIVVSSLSFTRNIMKIKMIFLIFLFESCDVNISKLHKLYEHSKVKKTLTMSLENDFKKQTTSENETRLQIAAAQANLTCQLLCMLQKDQQSLW